MTALHWGIKWSHEGFLVLSDTFLALLCVMFLVLLSLSFNIVFLVGSGN